MEQAIAALQQSVLEPLIQEINTLRAEREQLQAEVKHLQSQQQLLRNHYLKSLFEQQLVQQQQLLQQLVGDVTAHLQSYLAQQLAQPSSQSLSQGLSQQNDPDWQRKTGGRSAIALEQMTRSLEVLSARFQATCEALEQEFEDHQGLLSNQLDRMQSLEQQGEAILATLVVRLNRQLHLTTSQLQQSESQGNVSLTPRQGDRLRLRPPNPSPPSSQPSSWWQRFRFHQRQGLEPWLERLQLPLGFVLILLASGALAFSYLGLRGMVGTATLTLPLSANGGISPSLGNILGIVWLRMVGVVVLLTITAGMLEPTVWPGIRQVIVQANGRLWGAIAAGGTCLFLIHTLLALALTVLPAPQTVGLFFLYPLGLGALNWLVRRDRPSWSRICVLGLVGLGGGLLLQGGSGNGWGSSAAAAAGVGFVGLTFWSHVCWRHVHPVSLSLLHFGFAFLLSSLGVLIPWPRPLAPDESLAQSPALLVAALLLGMVTAGAYLLNYQGSRLVGTARAAGLGSGGPLLTAVMGTFLLPLESLSFWQICGVVLVTVGGSLFHWGRLHLELPPSYFPSNL